MIDAILPTPTAEDVDLPRYEFGPGNPGTTPGGEKDRRKYERKLEKELNDENESILLKNKCRLT